MADDDAAGRPIASNPVPYEIIESASDPNRPWQLIVRDAGGTETSRIGFKTYGDAWRAAERRTSEADSRQTNLLTVAQPRQDPRPSEYQTDILTWSERQAALLRRVAAGEKVGDQIDWDNVVDEIESAGRRQLTQARSLLVEAMVALLKAKVWPLSPEVPRWQKEALGLQRDAAAVLVPSMRQRIDTNELYFRALRRLPKTVDGQEPRLFPTECPVTLDDLLGD